MDSLLQTPSHRLFRLFGFAMGGASLLVALVATAPATWVFLASSVAWAYLGHRLAESGAWTEGCSLRIRNPFSRVYSIDSAEVQRFEMARWGPFPSMGYALLKDGTRVHIWGIQARNPAFIKNDRDVDQMMLDLATWLQGCS